MRLERNGDGFEAVEDSEFALMARKSAWTNVEACGLGDRFVLSFTIVGIQRFVGL